MSSALELSGARLTGVDQSPEVEGRSATQMSTSPRPPGRSDPNHNVKPSAEIAALVSRSSLFTAATASGVPKGSAADERRANQTSLFVPVFRLVVKKICRESPVSVGFSTFEAMPAP